MKDPSVRLRRQEICRRSGAEAKATGRPLTAEEEAAVARGIRELGPQAAGQHMLVVVHGVNVHVSPLPGAEIVSTLPRGLKVAMIEQRGQWTLVEIEDSTRRKQ